jgi:hypothetical protein
MFLLPYYLYYRLADCLVKKVQSAQFGMVLLAWLWLFPRPYLDQEMDYGGYHFY